MTREPGEALEPFRSYFQVLAELHLDRRLRGKPDTSDVVQQTMLRAYSAFGELRSREPEVLTAWLRRILASTRADAVKYSERDKRDIHLERSLKADLDRSASGFAAWLAADQTSPSRQLERNEELLRLVDALARLPERMREVVLLKHCQRRGRAVRHRARSSALIVVVQELAERRHPAAEQPGDGGRAAAHAAADLLGRKALEMVHLHRRPLVLRQPGEGLGQPQELLLARGSAAGGGGVGLQPTL
jgi:RNA polymerase sigma-70 factor (ECF subfamily)